MQTISLIGMPTDAGAGIQGSDLGPDALRRAGLGSALKTPDTCFIDNGNLSGPTTPWSEPVNGLRHLYEVAHWNQSIYVKTRLVIYAFNEQIRSLFLPLFERLNRCVML